MVPSVRHAGQGTIVETLKKISGCQRFSGEGGRDEEVKHRGFLGQ